MESIRSFFEPAAVAVVGASSNPLAAGGRLVRYLDRSFPGAIHPVNPRHERVHGLPAVSSVADIPRGIDLAVIAVPAGDVLDVVNGLGERDVHAVILFSAGFAEAGSEGAMLQDQIVRATRDHGMRLCGPNSLGFVNVGHGLYATFTSSVDPEPSGGNTAVVSQSGGFGAMFLSVATQLDLGVGFFCATGNEADVSVAEVIEYLVERPDVDTIVSFVESIQDPDALDRAARRAADLDKPIAIAKVGATPAGAEAALSHSAAIVGDDAAYDAFFDELGIIRVRGLDGMLDAARVFGNGRRVSGRNLGIVTASGGGGVLLADAASEAGLVVPSFDEAAQQRVARHIPAFGAAGNPVDTTAQVTAHPEHFADVLTEVAALETVDALLAFLGPLDHVADQLVAAVRGALEHTEKPIVVAWGGGSARFKRQLDRSGVPSFDDPDRAVRALGWLARHSLRQPRTERSPLGVNESRRGAARKHLEHASGEVLLESEVKQLLKRYGIPVVTEHVVRDDGDVDRLAMSGDGPWVVKVLSRDLPHKSDVGGVRLGIETSGLPSAIRALRTEVERAAPTAQIEGVLIQEQLCADHELVCGVTRDARLGPIVSVGWGGRAVEIVGEVASHRAPLAPDQARDLLMKVFDGRLVTHPRGLDETQCDAVVQALVNLGSLAAELPEIVELDINPLVVARGAVAVVDALARADQSKPFR